MADKLKMAVFDDKEARTIFEALSGHYAIIAPVERPGRGRFLDTSLLTYDEVKGFDEIDFFRRTYFSAKAVLFPIRQTLFRCSNGRIEDAAAEIRPTIVFLRSCDIHAVRVMDAHFLRDAGYEDNYYKERRENIKLFLIECAKPFDGCFCSSLGTNMTYDYSAFMRRGGDLYEIIVKDDELKTFFPGGTDLVERPRFAQEDPSPIDIPEEIETSIFEDGVWKEYTSRCIACGRCTVSCPTCSCFSVQDVLPEEGEAAGRVRTWSSCHVKRFAVLAGNHDFRGKEGDRMRYKVLHKIRDFKRRHGFNMCVGCGRCDAVCPEYISIFRCIEKINDIIKARQNG